jgi:hypothetical protein
MGMAEAVCEYYLLLNGVGKAARQSRRRELTARMPTSPGERKGGETEQAKRVDRPEYRLAWARERRKRAREGNGGGAAT